MELNTYGDISPRTATKASKRLLRVGLPLLVTQRYGQVDNQPKKSTKTRSWRRYHSLPITTAPLAEGINPPGNKIAYTDYTARLEMYGDVVNLTDVIEDTHEDPVLQEMMDRCGEQMAQVIEVVTISVLKSGTNVYYAGGVATRGTVDSKVTRGDLRKVVRGFDRANATPISRIISPNPKVSTQGVEAGFFAMGHTDLEPDIRGLTGFASTVEYANPGEAQRGEIGKMERVRFVLTSLWDPWAAAGASGTTYLSNGVAVTSSAACDVYPLVIVARDGYAVVRLQGRGAVGVSVLNPNTPRGGDALGRNGSVGWKCYYACAITNQLWIARVECAATANPT